MLEFLFWIFFIFIVIGYVFRLFLRYGLPWLLKRFMQNQQKKYSESFNSNNSFNQNSDKGEVNIKKKRKRKLIATKVILENTLIMKILKNNILSIKRKIPKNGQK